MSDILNKIFSIESVVKWGPKIMKEHLPEIHEYEPYAENEFNFMNFIINLVSCYRVYLEDVSASLEALDSLETSLLKLTKIPESGEFLHDIQDGLLHVILATKISVLMKKGDMSQIVPVFERIQPIDAMNNKNKASIYAIHAAVLALFSNEDESKAFTYIDKALELDSNTTQWIYLKALFTRKIRFLRNRFEVPSLQEKELFEKVHEKDPNNVVYKLYLAAVYREVSLYAFKRRNECTNFLPKDNSLVSDLKDSAALKDEKSLQFYKEARKQYPDSPFVTFRYVYGVITINKLDPNTKNVNDMLKKALEKEPQSGYGHLVAANYFEKLNKESKMIKHHLEMCQKLNVFDAEINLIRLLYKENPGSFNPIESLLNLIKKYTDKYRHAMIFTQIISYALLIQNDLLKSIEYTKKFYDLNVSSSCLKVHRSCFVTYAGPFNLLDVLIDEIKFKMWSQETPKEVCKTCEEFMHYMNFQNVTIVKGYPQNFKSQILEGKPMFYNPKCQGKPTDKPNSKRNSNEARPRNATNDGRKFPQRNPQNKAFAQRENAPACRINKNNDRVPMVRKNTQHTVSQLPSLMDTLCITSKEEKPSVGVEVEESKIEKSKVTVEPTPKSLPPAEPKEECSSPPLDSNTEKLLKHILKTLAKNEGDLKSRSSRRRKSTSSSSESDSDEFTAAILKKLGLGDKKKKSRRKNRSETDSDSKFSYRQKKDRKKHSHRKKYDSSSSGSEYESKRSHRRKDRSLERLRKECRTGSDGSDSEKKYKSRHHRDDSSTDRSTRKYTDSHYDKKHTSRSHREERSRDRRNRRCVSPDERSHRRRHHSKHKESHRRRRDSRDSESLEHRSVRDVSLSSRRSKKDHRYEKMSDSARRTPLLDQFSDHLPENSEKQNKLVRDSSRETTRTRKQSTSPHERSKRRNSRHKESQRRRRDSRSLERESARDLSVSPNRYRKRDRSLKNENSCDRRIPTSENKSKNEKKRDNSLESARARERSPRYDFKGEDSRRKRRESRSSERTSVRDLSSSSSGYSKRDYGRKSKKNGDRRIRRTPSSDRVSKAVPTSRRADSHNEESNKHHHSSESKKIRESCSSLDVHSTSDSKNGKKTDEKIA